MAVRLVVLDCDLTLWDHPNVSELRSPFTRANDETVADADGIQIRLFPGARALLEGLRERGVLISIASWNRPEPVFEILQLLNLADFFARPKVEFHPYKEKTIAALLDELRSEGIVLAPDEVLYVDDRAMHLRRVMAAVGPIHTLEMGRDITELKQVLDFIKFPRWDGSGC
ncbi:MAG TPA: magnesium-dependent phosphatase-1 [bacterium]